MISCTTATAFILSPGKASLYITPGPKLSALLHPLFPPLYFRGPKESQNLKDPICRPTYSCMLEPQVKPKPMTVMATCCASQRNMSHGFSIAASLTSLSIEIERDDLQCRDIRLCPEECSAAKSPFVRTSVGKSRDRKLRALVGFGRVWLVRDLPPSSRLLLPFFCERPPHAPLAANMPKPDRLIPPISESYHDFRVSRHLPELREELGQYFVLHSDSVAFQVIDGVMRHSVVSRAR